MSPIGAAHTLGAASFPRVSGDEPLGKPNKVCAGVFSPRERG